MAGLEAEDFFSNGGQGGEDEIVGAGTDPGGFEEHGGATDGAGGFGVLPFVTDDEGVFEVNVPFEGGFGEQAGLGLAAGAAVGFIMRADKDIVEREATAEQIVHAVEFAAGDGAVGEAGLIGGGDEDEAGGLEILEERQGLLVDVELVERAGRDLLLAFGARQVEDAVALDEYRCLHACDKAKSSPDATEI